MSSSEGYLTEEEEIETKPNIHTYQVPVRTGPIDPNEAPEHIRSAVAAAGSPTPSDTSSCVVVEGSAGKARFTVLTSRLIRMEWAPLDGEFEDRPSLAVWNRDLPKPKFQIVRSETSVEVFTGHLHLRLEDAAVCGTFANGALSVRVKDGSEWEYGQRDELNLGGTARTLDGVDGRDVVVDWVNTSDEGQGVPIETGLVSLSGFSVIDDSGTPVFGEEGWVQTRGGDAAGGDNNSSDKGKAAAGSGSAPTNGSVDVYFFGYGHNYNSCMRDYTRIAGSPPLIPRYALGNWWSRYWAYEADELVTLMGEFKEKDIPLSVCVVDMDWHVVANESGVSGWTGYTWNNDLIPDPKKFIDDLHACGLRVALNVHPGDGCQPHEEAYAAMAAEMGVENGEPVLFDITEPKFVSAYLKHLHAPRESEGVDFWWVDWQQGSETATPGVDPLFWLNHVHALDRAKDNNRPFLLSRYGGLGSHRYPIGFSGDTVVSWDSLAFQPYFTAMAANVAYGWWSHDIGGHFGGVEDAELYVRWCQWGAFSPILRLHSCKSEFADRRPWAHGVEAREAASEALRLRTRLIPYLYTAAWKYSREGVAPLRPLYYSAGNVEDAYHCPSEYLYGTDDVIVAPFTRAMDTELRLSRVSVWLPLGVWYEFESGHAREGNNWYAIYGDIETIPVFARAGAIVPMAADHNSGADNPSAFEVRVFAGSNGSFTLYEDDGVTTAATESGEWRTTTFTQQRNLEGTWCEVTVSPAVYGSESAKENDSIGPATRSYTFVLVGVTPNGDTRVVVTLDGEVVEVEHSFDTYREAVSFAAVEVGVGSELKIDITTSTGNLLYHRDRTLDVARRVILQNCRLASDWKSSLAEALPDMLYDDISCIPEGAKEEVPASILRALIEVVCGVGCDNFVVDTGYRESELAVLWNRDEDKRLKLVSSRKNRKAVARPIEKREFVGVESRNRKMAVDFFGLVSVAL